MAKELGCTFMQLKDAVERSFLIQAYTYGKGRGSKTFFTTSHFLSMFLKMQKIQFLNDLDRDRYVLQYIEHIVIIRQTLLRRE
jgi:hypothetical protein